LYGGSLKPGSVILLDGSPQDITIMRSPLITTDSEARKNAPVYSGVMAYFPLAMIEIARLSKVGNDKHNPGQHLHWSRDKSTDHADCIARHLLEHGKLDDDGITHTAKVAWRALALLQVEMEKSAV
jgi:hypothetical protein